MEIKAVLIPGQVVRGSQGRVLPGRQLAGIWGLDGGTMVSPNWRRTRPGRLVERGWLAGMPGSAVEECDEFG